MKCRHLFVAFALLLSLPSCSWLERGAVAKLDIAEEQMKECPDSSLLTLQSINARRLLSGAGRARYALLLTQAQDKNYIDTANDSLINVAVDYYARKDDRAHLFLSLYYKGRICSNGNDYTNAMLAYSQAEELADYSNDDYAKGLLYAHLGLLYYNSYDFSKSLDNYQKAYDFYGRAGRTYLQQYTQSEIGESLIKLRHYDQAERSITEAMEWFYDNGYESECQRCVQLLDFLYKEMGSKTKLLSLHSSKYSEGCDNLLFIHLTKAHLFALDHNRPMAEKHLDIAQQLSTDLQDSLLWINEKFYTRKVPGDYEQALELCEELSYIQDSVVRYTLQQPVVTLQKDYFQAQSKKKEMEITQRKTIQVLTTIIFILVIGLTYLYMKHRMKVKDMEISRLIELSHTLKSTLFDKDVEISSMGQQITELFDKQFQLIGTLSTTFYETQGDDKEHEAIYKCVKQEILKLQKSVKHIHRLEHIVDQYKSNVMTLMRSELTEFKEMDYRLLCFCYAGFSAKAISIFTNDSVANIYMRKSRLKAKIISSEAPHKDIMIRLLP